MEKKIAKLLGFTFVALMVLAVLPILPAFAVPTVYLDPSTVSYTTDMVLPGHKFNVTAWVSDVTDLFGYQVTIYYNATVLNCTKAVIPTTDSEFIFYAMAGYPPPPGSGYFDSWGYSLTGYSLLSGTASGTGKLAVFEFEIMASPPKLGSVTSDLIISYVPSGGVFDTKLKDNLGGTIPSTQIDGFFEYIWAPPPQTSITVDPSLVEYGPYPPSAVGEHFNISIMMNGLSPGWELVSVSLNKTFDPTLLEVLGVYEGDWWAGSGGAGGTTFDYVVGSDNVFINASLNTPYPSTFPYGTGAIAKIEFNVTFQGDYGDDKQCDLGFLDIELLDKDGTDITIEALETATPGLYKVNGLLTLPPPWLKAMSVTVGPEPVQGKTVDVVVKIKDVEWSWYLVGLQFRLSYDPEILEPVAAEEGPWLPSFAPYGTFPMSFFETNGIYGPHVLFGDLKLPNANGTFTEPWPEGSGTIATITFKVLKQYVDPNDIITELNFIEIKFTDKDVGSIPVDWLKTTNGTVTILGWTLTGRVIDLYTQYPAPYGGQGPNQPSDMFWPQKEVWLYTNVTYNWWPVQQKDVAFEIRDPQGVLWTTLVGTTDENGTALVKFRIPWPCDDPESLFGVWTVTASVDIACIIVNDTLQFHFDYLVRIWSVTPNKAPPEYYKHCETISITIEYGTHAQQCYPAVFTVVIHDDVNVPIGFVTVERCVGGTEFCEYKNDEFTVQIHVPKFAFAGYATIHANCLSAFPSEGGSAWCPEETATIIIYPGWVP